MNFIFQGSQKKHVRVAISQKALSRISWYAPHFKGFWIPFKMHLMICLETDCTFPRTLWQEDMIWFSVLQSTCFEIGAQSTSCHLCMSCTWISWKRLHDFDSKCPKTVAARKALVSEKYGIHILDLRRSCQHGQKKMADDDDGEEEKQLIDSPLLTLVT